MKSLLLLAPLCLIAAMHSGWLSAGASARSAGPSVAQAPLQARQDICEPVRDESHGDGVRSRAWLTTTGPLVDPATGSRVQVVAYSISFRSSERRVLGEIRGQVQMDWGGSEPIELALTGIDPWLGIAGAQPAPRGHGYKVLLTPAEGRAWGQVQSRSQAAVTVMRVQ